MRSSPLGSQGVGDASLACLFALLHWSLDIWTLILVQLETLVRQARGWLPGTAARGGSGGQVPHHLALVVLEDQISFADLARLLQWSIELRIPNLSLFDPLGRIKAQPYELKAALAAQIEAPDAPRIKWHHNGIQEDHPGRNGLSQGAGLVHIALVDRSDGRADIVATARGLAQRCARGEMVARDITEDLVGASLRANHGLPDPDCLIRFGRIQSNLGFLPWQSRLTEMHALPSHYRVLPTQWRGYPFQVMASALESFVNRMVSIITSDGRNFIGTLKGFDQTINLILDDTHERIFSPNQGVVLGLHIVRGDNIALVGELDEDMDGRLDLKSIRAEQIASMIH
eukprot:maker-scaffold161_size295871-snap-gene-1.28 protein:Tk05105 transcript:maker-scaffold161_size295871-snap-gene-1.28-mRNA-1 annotation:"hypothetical protein SINV_13023"